MVMEGDVLIFITPTSRTSAVIGKKRHANVVVTEHDQDDEFSVFYDDLGMRNAFCNAGSLSFLRISLSRPITRRFKMLRDEDRTRKKIFDGDSFNLSSVRRTLSRLISIVT